MRRPHAPKRNALAFVGGALLVMAELVPSDAFAQDTSRVAAATVLFDEGIKALDAGRLEEACPKLAKSQELAPSGGTLLALASCWERSGKLASAWVAYREAASRAASAGKSDAEMSASRNAARLESRLPKLTIRAPSGPADLEVRRDGILLTPAELGIAIPVDPGPHEVRASTPDGRTWRRSIEAREGAALTVNVPDVDRVDATGPEGTLRTEASTGPSSERRAPPSGTSTSRSTAPSTSSGRRTAGRVVAGAGVVIAGVGGAFGLMAKASNDDASGHCRSVDGRRLCGVEGLALIDDARSEALVSTILVSVGAAAILGGALLFFTAPKADRTTTSGTKLGGSGGASPLQELLKSPVLLRW